VARSQAVLAVAVVSVLALGAAPLRAQGGPPLITDDPDTPGPGYWEVNLSFQHEKKQGWHLDEAPRLDVNYGLGRRLQIKVEAPRLSREAGEATASGLGDTTAGVKWRFLGEEHHWIAWSVYPQYEFNTSHASVEKGLVDGGHALVLPTEVTIEAAHLEFNVEVGRDVVSGGPDTWFYGLATEAEIGRRLELVGEVHGETADAAPTEWIVNVGARQKLGRKLTLLVAVGHAFSGVEEDRPRLLTFLGLQFNLPHLYDWSRPPESAAARP
jgi:hypothetical protein